MIGHLTDKNNPFLEQNQTDPDIYQFPYQCSCLMTHQPYWEASFGVTEYPQLLHGGVRDGG
jgi:hypothetical protein